MAAFGRDGLNALGAANICRRRSDEFDPDLVVAPPHDIAALVGLAAPRQDQFEFVRETFDVFNGKPRSAFGRVNHGTLLKTRIVADVNPCRHVELLSRPAAVVVTHLDPFVQRAVNRLRETQSTNGTQDVFADAN
ncbi:MAG: hypothetical protein WBD95_04440 [Xanthobacteraceae bacterium]